MTAIVAVRMPDGVAIFTDGAVCDSQGVMDGVSTKPLLLPHLPAVLALRCGLPVHDAAARAADARYGNFDQLLSEFLPVLKAEIDSRSDEECGPFGRDLDGVLGGWSKERERAELYLVRQAPEDANLPWELVEATQTFMPMDAEVAGALAAQGIDLGRPDIATIEPWGVSVMQGMRGRYPVGAFVQLTVVTREVTVNRIAYRWPDRLGDRLAMPETAEAA